MSWIDDLGKLASPHDKGFNASYPDLRIEVNLEELVVMIKKLGGLTVMVFETKEQQLRFNPVVTDSLIKILTPSSVSPESTEGVLLSQIYGASKKDAEHIASLLALEEQSPSMFRTVWATRL